MGMYLYIYIYQHCIQQFKLHNHVYYWIFLFFSVSNQRNTASTASTTIFFRTPPKGRVPSTQKLIHRPATENMTSWFVVEPTPLEKNMFKSNWIRFPQTFGMIFVFFPKYLSWAPPPLRITHHPFFDQGTDRHPNWWLWDCKHCSIAPWLWRWLEKGLWRWNLFEMLRLKRCNCWIHEEKMVVYFPKKKTNHVFFLGPWPIAS